jgi:hypothetical protein
MNDLIQLTEAEIAAVAGGIYQNIYISATQSNSSYVTQSATAVNYGAVTATANGYGAVAAAAGAEANNTAVVLQANSIKALNTVRY